ncbi:hypothetical protein O3Q51_02180 [Cryomorphaceae bacterium 1068]|nr:hypothetical protein [Cryomorphaceae bacterium 1068]
MLLFWIVLFAFTTQAFANKLGIPSQFLSPEYQGVVGITSFMILGFALGAFIMAFNIYTYINHAHRFPFLGTLSRPFFKFCINNFIIPVAFIITYIWSSSAFLGAIELKTSFEIFLDMSAFLFGNALFIGLAFIYFFPTNKNIFKITGLSEAEFEAKLEKSIARNKKRGYRIPSVTEGSRWRVDTYLVNPFRVNLARESQHYDTETLKKVFYQNHVNASLFEAIIVLVFFVIGIFQHNDFFVIPAAASVCLVFTVVLMAISIVMSRLKGWTLTFFVILFLLVNWASSNWDILNQANYAYGLNYDKEPVAYNLATIDSLNNDLVRVNIDREHHERILKSKVIQIGGRDKSEKPKLVIVNATGGGLRSTLWTMRTLQYADSITLGKLMQHSVLMTGSSGGIIGASFFRELVLRKDSLGESIYGQTYRDKSSSDILNRVLFTFATNDIFIRFRRTQVDGKSYILDRGKTFENQLNRNTDNVMNKKLHDYYKPVSGGLIPMIVMAPSITNDGRRLLISSQPISFLSYEYPDLRDQLNIGSENIEFGRIFSQHDANDLRFTSALRMNATFPYIMPYANLPTEPKIEVMDAGLRDNLGTKITAQYLKVFQDWIEENTSGIIILQIRDTEKFTEPKEGNVSILDRLTNPIGSFYGNYFNDQDYNMDQLLEILQSSYEVPIYKIPLELRYELDEEIPLSWHLTALEKKMINEAIYRPHNEESLVKLKTLLH